ncbi:MAG: type 4a pilus biogenesis protein PilO [Elusimicrobiales bacterium]|nr:type 4a pilus biogenesis protein PilO [Elusimicrobiales bacterium]
MKNIKIDKDVVLKLFLLILIIFGFLYIYLSYFWFPISKNIKSLESKNKEMEKEISRAKNIITKYPDLQKKLLELQNQKESLKKKIPIDKNISDLFRIVKKLADKNSIYIDSIVPGDTVNENYYFRITYNLVIKGSYHDIGRFFAELSLQDRIIHIENLTMSGGDVSIASFVLVSYQYLEGT